MPAQLEKSAFGPEAIAAYRKFLKGERLQEKPIASDVQQMRMRRKMDMLQEGFRRWLRAGRDPAPIIHSLEDRLPTLLQANKLDEAEALIDDALKRVSETPLNPDR